jgi:hypothetical protein
MIIIPKRTTILGRIPTASDLEEGEIAINIADGGEKIYTKNAEGKIVLLGGSELYTLIKEARDHVDSSISIHNSSSTAHSDIREAITLTYSKNEENGDVLLKSVKSNEVLYPQTLETEVLDAQGTSLDVNLGEIRSDIEQRNLYYTASETGLSGIKDNVDGTGITLGNLPVPSEVEEITSSDTISSAIGKLYKMIKG